MARVYQGYDENLDRYAAIKVISGDFGTADEAEYNERFLKEARAIARLSHQNIVGVYQFGQDEGVYYMAMHFLDGEDLRAILRRYAREGRRMPSTDILRMASDMGDALDYAHIEGVVHRDIKPSNIMLTREGKSVLTDFGLALSVPEGTM
ncbi:MAG TPA: serine/threonine-protein kinase, partial [Aggregatilineales bacterium]|nr:serine/threonine-protein kinase [Aggregatilineales bacterium]